jgi:hypothetical protein
MDRDATEMSEYSLADALQRGPVIVDFYLFDFYPECTEHMCSLHDLLWFDLDDRVTTADCSCFGRFVIPSDESPYRPTGDSNGVLHLHGSLV